MGSENEQQVHTKPTEWKVERDSAVTEGTLPDMSDKLKPISERKDDKKAFEGARCIIIAPHQCGVCFESYEPMDALVICTKTGRVPDHNNSALRQLKQKLDEATEYEDRTEGFIDFIGKDGDNDVEAT